MSGRFATAKPHRIKAAHRRRGKVASGQSVQRYYDPGIGRFLSVDPVTANGNTGANFNRYWYAANNPYRYYDPDGRQAKNESGSSGNDCDAECKRRKQEERRRTRDKPFEWGGRLRAPTAQIAKWMSSSNAQDRLKAAQAARRYWEITAPVGTWLAVTTKSGDDASGDHLASGQINLFAEAFSSWSWLSTTIDHEYHHVGDSYDFSDMGIATSEVEAWQSSKANIGRFGNTPEEVSKINRSLNFWIEQYRYLKDEE